MNQSTHTKSRKINTSGSGHEGKTRDKHYMI
jgi:hypothetical protein